MTLPGPLYSGTVAGPHPASFHPLASRSNGSGAGITSPAVHRGNKHLIVVGDRVLIRLEDGEERTKVGLYLPPTAVDSQAVQGGQIVATGPGHPMPDFNDASEEPWRTTHRESTGKFVPMQARPGDFALFFRKAAVEITFESEVYLVVPQNALLALVREAGPD